MCQQRIEPERHRHAEHRHADRRTRCAHRALPARLTLTLTLTLTLNLTLPHASTAFNGVVKSAFDGLKPDSCELVPLPPPSLVTKFTGSEG